MNTKVIFLTNNSSYNITKLMFFAKEANQQMVGRTVGERPGNGVEMVYEHRPTEPRNTVGNRKGAGSGCKGFTTLHT